MWDSSDLLKTIHLKKCNVKKKLLIWAEVKLAHANRCRGGAIEDPTQLGDGKSERFLFLVVPSSRGHQPRNHKH